VKKDYFVSQNVFDWCHELCNKMIIGNANRGVKPMIKWTKEIAGLYVSDCGRIEIDGNGGNGVDSTRVWTVSTDGYMHDAFNTLGEAKEACQNSIGAAE
jgi:hypothetical protein